MAQSESEFGALCTYAATGPNPTFQPIFICRTCATVSCKQDESESESESKFGNDHEGDNNTGPVIGSASGGDSGVQSPTDAMPLCICQNCAEACHEALGHDVEYVGSGLSYCDCHTLQDEDCSCLLHFQSLGVANRLGIYQENSAGIEGGIGVNYNLPDPLELEASNVLIAEGDGENCPRKGKRKEHDFKFTFEALCIPALLQRDENSSSRSSHPGQANPCEILIDQALEFVKHSVDTHWIPHDATNVADMCMLEKLAYLIFERHVNEYDLNEMLIGSNGGAEWWVQVKEIDLSSEKDGSAPSQAIDLHYDKDEELAETFEIGSFPTLSTVTYFTSNNLRDINGSDRTATAPPTVIFPHTYEMDDDGPIGGVTFDADSGEMKMNMSTSPQMIISHSKVGKHIVFDGKLLHGAPSNPILRQKSEHSHFEDHVSDVHKGIRVTFLVNIWLTRRPSKVILLPESIRDKVKDCHIDGSANCLSFLNENPLSMVKRNIKTLNVHDDDRKRPDSRLNLPFVSTGATWVDDMDMDGEEEEGLVVSIFPPPQYEADSVYIKFDEGLVPMLEHLGNESEEEDEEVEG